MFPFLFLPHEGFSSEIVVHQIPELESRFFLKPSPLYPLFPFVPGHFPVEQPCPPPCLVLVFPKWTIPLFVSKTILKLAPTLNNTQSYSPILFFNFFVYKLVLFFQINEPDRSSHFSLSAVPCLEFVFPPPDNALVTLFLYFPHKLRSHHSRPSEAFLLLRIRLNPT